MVDGLSLGSTTAGIEEEKKQQTSGKDPGRSRNLDPFHRVAFVEIS